MTRSTYKRLRAVQFVGGAAFLATIIFNWFVPMMPLVIIATFFIFGVPASVAAWLLRDQKLDEIPY